MVSYWIGVSMVSMMDQATNQQKRIYASFLSQIDWTKRILVHKSHEKNWINFQNWIWRRNGSASFNLVFWSLVVEILILVNNDNSTAVATAWLELNCWGIPDSDGIHGSLGSQGIRIPGNESQTIDPRDPIPVIPFEYPWVGRNWVSQCQSQMGVRLVNWNKNRWNCDLVTDRPTDRQTGHDAVPIYK